MKNTATLAAQTIATELNLSVDDAMFMQTIPLKLLVAIGKGQINLHAMANEELASRGMDTQGTWVGFDPSGDRPVAGVSVDQFANDEHERIEAFRSQWHQAHKVAPKQFPLVLPEDNAGLWHEQMHDFDLSSPFVPQVQMPVERDSLDFHDSVSDSQKKAGARRSPGRKS